MAEQNGRNVGHIEEIQSVVVECVFPDRLPEIYNAIEIEMPARPGTEASRLVAEVQQHLGDDRLRAVAMDSTDGLARGQEVSRHRWADQRAGRQGRRSAGCSTCWASRSTTGPRSTSRSAGRSTATRRTSRT